MRIRRRRDELERRLDSERPQPPDEFISRLTGRITPAPIRRRSGWSIALAASLTTLLTVALALTGGIGYAAGAAKDGTTAVTSLVSSAADPVTSSDSSGTSSESSDKSGKSDQSSGKSGKSGKSDQGSGNSGDPNESAKTDNESNSVASGSGSQGDHKQAVCHVPPGNPDNAHTIVVDDSAVPTHLDHGDTLGPCPEEPGPPDDQYEEKVLICHIPPGNPENPQTISVSVNAVPAHLAHGDTEGPCPEDT